MENHSLSEELGELAQRVGIDALGFTHSAAFPGYLLDNHQRRDPALSLPGAKSIIVAGIYIGAAVMPQWQDPGFGRTSRLFLSGFFLDVVEPLLPLADLLKSRGHRALICDGSTADGSILPLKLAAVRAGLGWQGKHSLLISRKFGSFLALGGIITDADLEHNTRREPDRCGSCGQCRAACPMGALEETYILETKNCLSYQLQEDYLSPRAKSVMGNRIGDCEICQEACPWNHKHLKAPLQTKMTERFRAEIDKLLDHFNLANLGGMTRGEYNKVFGGLNTGISYGLFRRNVGIALQGSERASGTKPRMDTDRP